MRNKILVKLQANLPVIPYRLRRLLIFKDCLILEKKEVKFLIYKKIE
jgi:hypothetical protein